MIRSTAPLPSALINLRLVEEVLYDLPPLEGVFLHWHTYGVKATTAGTDALFARRKQLLGSTTLSGSSFQLLFECATDCLRNLPVQEPYAPWDSRPLHARILRHGPRLCAADTQALLPPGVLVQQTQSISLANTLLLCTSVGLQVLTHRHLRTLAATLALPRWTVKRCTFNAPTYRSGGTFATEPGLISPFLPPSRDAGVTALVILPWPKRWEAQEREVAIALSLWESLLLPLRCLRQLLRLYATRAYPAVRIIELASEKASADDTDKHTIQRRAVHLNRGSASSTWETGGTRPYPDTRSLPASLKKLSFDEGG
jgi:hypothetical protein